MLRKAVKFDRDALQNRILFCGLVLWAFVLLVACRYFWLQVVRGDEYAERARVMAIGDHVSQTPRGKILDRNGRELAISRMAKSLCIDPSEVKDADKVANDLSPIINVPVDEIKADIARGGGFVWVKRLLELDEEKAVAKLIDEKDYYTCVGFRDEVKRYYPNDMLAANVLGFVGAEDEGREGIEHSMDALIKGDDNIEASKRAQQEHPVWSLMSTKKGSSEKCKDVTLTIDSNIQFIVEQALERAIQTTNPHAITAIVMDPRNGDILAMASRPSYNPNKYWEYEGAWRNRAVSFIYEPGSTFKAMVAGAALQEKVVAPNQWFVDPGHITVSGRRIQNWSGDSFGTITFTDVVKNSINTSFAQIGMDMGGAKLTEYARAFGFGEYTNIELPGEECGILFDPDDMRDSDVATMSIGHSIAVTPLQLVTAMSAIANDGVLLHPNIIKKINNADGSIYQENGRTEVRRVLESATDKTLVGLLEQVVATGGGAKAGVKGYRIAGKTGTAQKIREDGAGYMDNRYIASFCGFAPVENPQITLLVMIDDPVGEFYGGQIAAPVASDIFTQLFRYLHIEPSSDPFVGLEKENKAAAPVQPIQPINIPPVPEGKVQVPNLQGKTIRQASQTLSELGLTINVHGSGVCTGQDLPPYSAVDPGATITVFFEP